MNRKSFSEESTQFWIRKQLHAEQFVWGTSFLEKRYMFPCHRLPRERAERKKIDRNNKDIIGNVNRVLPGDLVKKYQIGGVVYNFAIAHFSPFFQHYFNNYVYFEPILQVDLDKRFYRDHLYHQIKVAEVIDFFLTNANERILNHATHNLLETDYYKRFLTHFPASRYKKSEILLTGSRVQQLLLSALWLAALFHDLGYLFYMYQKIRKKVNNFFPFLGGTCLSDLITALEHHDFRKSIIAGYMIETGRQEENTICEVMAKLADGENHSVPSAIQILFLRDQMLLKGLSLTVEANFIYELAALFVFAHQELKSNEYEHININFKDNPFACILCIADNIQEWGRFALNQMKFVQQCEFVEVELSNTILKAQFGIKAEFQEEWEIPSFDIIREFPLRIESDVIPSCK